MRVMKPRVSLTQFAQSSPLFTLEELGHRYGKKKLTRSVRNMLYRLKRQGRVRQLTKGVYVGALATVLEYLRLLRMPWLYARLGFLLDRHAEKLFFKGKSRDAFLKRLPRGVAYLDRKRPGNRWVPTWNLMVAETLAPSTEQVVRT